MKQVVKDVTGRVVGQIKTHGQHTFEAAHEPVHEPACKTGQGGSDA
jgi:hypothetical protein